MWHHSANLVCDLQANSIPELWAKVHRLQVYALLDADVVEHGAAATVLLYDLLARAEQSLEAAAAAALQCPLLTGLLSLPAICFCCDVYRYTSVYVVTLTE